MNIHAMNDRAVKKRIAELGPWFHNMVLRGIPTAPEHFLGDYPRVKYAQFSHVIPRDLTGRSVLDIGCNAGFYAQEMKRRGAARVLGIDSDEGYLAQARFAAALNGIDIEFRRLDVYDIATLAERFDVVIFMGVLYHLRHPLLALDLIAEHCAGDLMLFQAMQRGCARSSRPAEDYDFWNVEVFDDAAFPKLHFVERAYAGDATNWWIPNAPCVEAMLRSAGFDILCRPETEVYLCRRAPDASQKGRL